MSRLDKIDIGILGLATWRLSSYLANEQGPAGICEKLRSLVGVDYQNDNQIPKNWLASELICQWCCSIYAGVFWIILYRFFPKFARWIALPFALSTLAILIMTSKQIQIFVKHLND